MATPLSRFAMIAAAVYVLAAAGCGGSNAKPVVDAGPPDADFSICVGGDAAPYMAGSTTPSRSGAFVATVVSVRTTSSDAPPVDAPAVGLSTFTVTITDSGGGVPAGMTMTAEKPYMPAHGHSASIVPTVSSTQAGTFVVSNISFFQPGDFQLTLNLQSASSAGDGNGGDGGGAGVDGGADDGAAAAPVVTTDKVVLEICVPA